jgi:hypothetical protein
MKIKGKKIKELLIKLQDDILDEYNKGLISYDEMVNVMNWTKKVIERKDENL